MGLGGQQNVARAWIISSTSQHIYLGTSYHTFSNLVTGWLGYTVHTYLGGILGNGQRRMDG